MGTGIVKEEFDERDYARFRARLEQHLSEFGRLLERPGFGCRPGGDRPLPGGGRRPNSDPHGHCDLVTITILTRCGMLILRNE